jgi:RecA-family ATPase
MNNDSEIKPIFQLGTQGYLHLEQAFSEQAPELDFVFDGLLAGTVGSIVAAGSTGKSYLALGILADLATGKNHLGLDIQECDQGTVYLTIEDPREILHQRIHAIGSMLDPSDRLKMQQRTHIESQVGNLIHIVDANGYYNQKMLDDMCLAFEGKRLVILDTLRRFHGGNENDSGHMSTLISCFEHIAQRTGAAILFLHHVNKTSSFQGTGLDQGASRGSAALTDNIRCQINLNTMSADDAKQYGIDEADRTKYVQLYNSKANYQKDQGVRWFKRGLGGVLMRHNFNASNIIRGRK